MERDAPLAKRVIEALCTYLRKTVGRISEKNVKDSVFILFSGQEGTEAVTLFLIER